MLRNSKRGQSNSKMVLFIVIYWLVFGIFFLSFSSAGGVNLEEINSTISTINTTVQITDGGAVTTPTISSGVPLFVRFFGFGITGIPVILALIINIPPTLTLLFIIMQLIRGSN